MMSIIFVAGSVVVLLSGFKLAIRVILRLFSSPSPPETLGEWSVVTGCTSGIGEALAIQLAVKGQSLILVSRDELKLEEMKEKIQRIAKNTKIETVPLDFTNSLDNPDKALEPLADAIKHKDIGVVINNAGISYDHAMYFHELPKNEANAILNVNLRWPIHITSLLLPELIKKRKGAIIFIGSGAGCIPSDPLYSVYAASKSGIQSFARSLQTEYREHNLMVQCHTPLYVATKMSKIRKTSFTIPSADVFATSVLRSVGKKSIWDDPTVSPFLPHSMLLPIIRNIPEVLWGLFRIKQNKELRRRWLSKNQSI